MGEDNEMFGGEEKHTVFPLPLSACKCKCNLQMYLYTDVMARQSTQTLPIKAPLPPSACPLRQSFQSLRCKKSSRGAIRILLICK